MRIKQRITVLLAAILIGASISGCRIIQVVPAGGDITSRTRLHDCRGTQTCVLQPASGAAFGDTFTAVPKPGYRFAGWGPGLCQGQEGPCVLEGITGALTALEVDVYLRPTFVRRQLNDTGITFSGAAEVRNNTDCIGASAQAQDCATGRDVTHYDDSDGFAGFSFTRLDSQGRATNAEQLPLCVRDNVTGLTWEARSSGITRYFWNQHAQRVAAVNAERLCGFQDWRVPTIKELESLLILPGYPVLHLDYRFFDGIREKFWTKTRSTWDDGLNVFYIDFDFGAIYTSSVYDYLPLRLVRGGVTPAPTPSTCDSRFPANTPSSQFVDNADGTVTDLATNLMWKRCSEEHAQDASCTPGDYPYFTWQQALDRAHAVNGGTGYAGHRDWRLPNVRELRSIVEESCDFPSINSAVFPNTQPGNYWTSSVAGEWFSVVNQRVWVVAFQLGRPVTEFRDWEYSVRLVRDLN